MTHFLNHRRHLSDGGSLDLCDRGGGLLDLLGVDSLDGSSKCDRLSGDGLLFGNRGHESDHGDLGGRGRYRSWGWFRSGGVRGCDRVGGRIDKGVHGRVRGGRFVYKHRWFGVDRCDRFGWEGSGWARFGREVASEVGLGHVLNVVEESHCGGYGLS